MLAVIKTLRVKRNYQCYNFLATPTLPLVIFQRVGPKVYQQPVTLMQINVELKLSYVCKDLYLFRSLMRC